MDDRKAVDGPLVLVVEDEPIIRLNAIDLVEAAGYVAVEASNAVEAVAILEARIDIRIVFTDIDMPGGMNGMLLAAAIRDRWPPIEIILTSGAMVPASEMLPDRSRFVPKPYTGRDVEQALRAFDTAA